MIKMPKFLCEEMQEYLSMLYGLKKKDRIFTVTKSYLHHEMDRGANAAGVKRIRIHDLRHPYVKQKTKKFAIHFGTGRSVFHSLRPYPSEPLHVVLCVASFPKKSRTA